MEAQVRKSPHPLAWVAGIAVILSNAYQCGTTSRMLHEQARRLQRNELARLYHWKVNIRLTRCPFRKNSSSQKNLV